MSLQAEKLVFSYGTSTILDQIALSIQKQEVTSIIGPNGIGKSTLLRCLANIYKPQFGTVYLNGESIATLPPRELAKELGYVPQIQSDVFSITVYEAILLGRKPYISWSVKPRDLEIVDNIVSRLGLERFTERTINTLSGGERQKVAIARALAQEPSILFLDEPTSSLDMGHQLELMQLVVELVHEQASTVIMVLHDLNLAARFSDEMFLLGPFGIHVHGSPQDVLIPENIKEVYGVEVEIIPTSQGPYVLPLRVVDCGGAGYA